jgi:hypothetical protein
MTITIELEVVIVIEGRNSHSIIIILLLSSSSLLLLLLYYCKFVFKRELYGSIGQPPKRVAYDPHQGAEQ